MKFDLFLNKIHQAATIELPGILSHQKMMPAKRELLLQNIDFKTVKPKVASVMMLFYPKNETTYLALIKRNSFGVHSSQIAFPGGKFEIQDSNNQQTALRETEEEIGVLATNIEVICAFTETYIPPSNFIVYPFLGVCTHEINFIIQEDEVAGMVEIPLEMLLNDKSIIATKMDTSYAKFVNVPAFQFNDQIVWGATAMIMSELKDVLKMVF